jgi:small basic protein
MDNPSIMLESKKAGLIAVMVAACLGSNYALIGVANLKIMDLLVFVSGFVFGPLIGASVGVLVWAVYGALNPYGFVPQIWIATMLSESIYGIAGGLLSRPLSAASLPGNKTELSVLFGAMGFLLTFIYDLVTNIVFALTFNIPIIAALLAGTPFAIIHEASNAALFGICSIPLITVLERSYRGVGLWRP